MDPYLYEYLDAVIIQQSSAEEAFRRFDDIANRHTDNLRKITKQVQVISSEIWTGFKMIKYEN